MIIEVDPWRLSIGVADDHEVFRDFNLQMCAVEIRHGVVRGLLSHDHVLFVEVVLDLDHSSLPDAEQSQVLLGCIAFWLFDGREGVGDQLRVVDMLPCLVPQIYCILVVIGKLVWVFQRCHGHRHHERLNEKLERLVVDSNRYYAVEHPQIRRDVRVVFQV